MKVYVISDTHFNHDKIAEYCKRPDNHYKLMKSGMEGISSKDCIVHLGDFCLGKEEEMHKEFLSGVKARKILVLGNHDSKSWSWYMSHGWDFVCDAFRLYYGGKWIMFSHIPQPWDGVWDINIHGHLHNLGHREGEHSFKRQWHRLYAPELMDYRPIELSKLLV